MAVRAAADPVGLSGVKLDFHVHSDAEDAVLHEILEAACAHSPVYDTTTRPVAVEARITES